MVDDLQLKGIRMWFRTTGKQDPAVFEKCFLE
jgi:hypothetical protein